MINQGYGGTQAGGGSLEVLQVTLLGAAGCGKTALINAFVNNNCPAVYTATSKRRLYCKALGISTGTPAAGAALGAGSSPTETPLNTARSSAGGLGSVSSTGLVGEPALLSAFLGGVNAEALAPPTPVLAQVEDTCASRLTNGENLDQGYGGDLEECGTDLDAPLAILGRTGFMIVFDACDRGTLVEAQAVFTALERALGEVGIMAVVYLVANKSDKAVENTEAARVLTEARVFAERKSHGFLSLQFKLATAHELRQVRQLFQALLRDVLIAAPGQPGYEGRAALGSVSLAGVAASGQRGLLNIANSTPSGANWKADGAQATRPRDEATQGTPRVTEEHCVAQ